MLQDGNIHLRFFISGKPHEEKIRRAVGYRCARMIAAAANRRPSTLPLVRSPPHGRCRRPQQLLY
ncbi:hypothetical protein OK348_11660 [Flavobacterium sp. MXW15]|uniref:Uncharacterized protein n=1 Tax=Xanthomonas chitinilytica TaxID=2989819 RepID=A0ABT3JYD7_9XANT|nr:hypothetical protein [Xanthomonas sp. H13-6]MCW4455446.1 hypothetical protein [Flavobacterium sp. MXW15]MCW4473473.1 hypothetical protein [Xanthomonas sp. H13-6]